MRRLILLTATLIGLAFIASGCMTREVEYQGVKYRQTQFGINQSVGRLSIQIPDGPKVEIENYSSDGAQAVGVAVEAAVKAAIKSAAPTP
jgi:hypothetical protein